VRVIGGDDGARVILYAGERQDVPIVMHGPFVGESREDIVRLSRAYVQGRLPRISELAREGGSGRREEENGKRQSERPLPASRHPLPATEVTSGNRN